MTSRYPAISADIINLFAKRNTHAVEVAVPSELSDDQRAAIEQLAAATTVNPRSALT